MLRARRLAARIRFSGDAPGGGECAPVSAEAVRQFHLINELNISPAVTPLLYKNLNIALKNIFIPPRAVTAFVYASSEMQASCFPGDHGDGCIIRFSSALVDILDADEFKFVAGHELGHFLFAHRPPKSAAKRSGLEYLILQRAREISCDRMGLVACGSLEIAIRAMMKTISGLTGEHLRFDVGAFMSQLRRVSGDAAEQVWQTTHPPVLVRCRALLRFSSDIRNADGVGNFSRASAARLDEKIRDDLDKYVDGPARERIAAAKQKVRMWAAARDIAADGVFDKKGQEKFAAEFGHDNLEKMKRFLRMPKSKIRGAVAAKLKDAERELKTLIPAD